MADTTTLYYENGVAVPYDSLSEETKLIVNQAREAYEYKEKQEDPGYTPFLLVMTGFIVLAIVAVRKALQAKGTEILGSWNGRRETVRRGLFPEEKYADADERFRDLTKGYFVYHGRDILVAEPQYEKILNKRSHYYRRLAPELKQKFTDRVKEFINSKTFLIKSEEPFVDMPVLISATAVQLTFGLNKFQLPHFEYIRVFKEEYFAADNSLRVLAGHVYGNTITLAWNHFLQGQEEATDGVNLGLHEMAHALYFQLVEAASGRCQRFTRSFNEIMAEGAEVYELKHAKPSELYTENAYRNLQEFWAESVELFFERPAALKRTHPDVYEQLKEILKQDPVNELYPVIDV